MLSAVIWTVNGHSFLIDTCHLCIQAGSSLMGLLLSEFLDIVFCYLCLRPGRANVLKDLRTL